MDGVSESRNKGWRGADSEVRKFREGGMESKTKENRTAGTHKKKTNKQKNHNTMASMTGNQQNHEIITKKHEKCNHNGKMSSM